MSVLVKICGVTTVEDAQSIAGLGADLLGLNFWPGSKRHVSMVRAEQIAQAARDINPEISIVGVFVNQSTIEIGHLVDSLALDYVQLHGNEPASLVANYGDDVIKAVALGDAADVARISDLPCERVLVDAPTSGFGGSGRTADWTLASQATATGKLIFLAGGLSPDNVAEAVARVRPYAVDVASGVEHAPGRKNAELVERFIALAKDGG